MSAWPYLLLCAFIPFVIASYRQHRWQAGVTVLTGLVALVGIIGGFQAGWGILVAGYGVLTMWAMCGPSRRNVVTQASLTPEQEALQDGAMTAAASEVLLGMNDRATLEVWRRHAHKTPELADYARRMEAAICRREAEDMADPGGRKRHASFAKARPEAARLIRQSGSDTPGTLGGRRHR